MLSLKQCLTDIANFAKSIKTTVSAKQNKKWTKIAESSGTISYNADKYNELLLITYFGGVRIKTFIPVITLTNSAQTHFVGMYNSVIYVNISKTTISVSKQPTGYTAELTLYGR